MPTHLRAFSDIDRGEIGHIDLVRLGRLHLDLVLLVVAMAVVTKEVANRLVVDLEERGFERVLQGRQTMINIVYFYMILIMTILLIVSVKY